MDLFWKVSSKAKEMISQKYETSGTVDESSGETSDSFTPGLRNEKPASSLSLETQQGNSDRDASSGSEGVNSEHNASPISKESDPTFEGEEFERSNLKMGISAGDLKDASHKAVESAKSIGSFLYGIANKTSRTVTETAKQLKTAVEENSILGDFNKEQEAFVTSKSFSAINECPSPWAGADDEENLKQQILSLSADKRNFLRSPPTGVMFDFNFDSMYPTAMIMLKQDPALEKMRFEVVPKLISEENFWRNYFYRVQLVKNSSRLSKTKLKTSSDDSSVSSEKSLSEDSVKGLDRTTVGHDEANDSDATDSPNHEFVSDSFQMNRLSEDDIKQGMKMLGVTDKTSRDDEWEKELKELQEYEVVAEGNDEDPDWENEIEQMLDEKVKDVV